MDHKFKQLHTFKNVTLSHEEKSLLRARMAHVIATPAGVTESLFHKGVQHGLRIALSSFLFVVFVSGSISAIADSALPGDPLYSFKVNVNEEVKAALLRTPEEKVAYQKSRIESRVMEIKTLAETKTLTKAKQESVHKALSGNVKALSKNLGKLSDSAPDTALSVTANLEETLKANKEAIESALPDADASTKAATLETVDSAIKQVSEEEVKILTKEIDSLTGDVESTNPNASSELTATTTTSPTPIQNQTTPFGP